MRGQQILFGLILTGTLAFFGCGGGGGGGSTPAEVVPTVEGTWLYTVDGQPSGLQIITQSGVNFTLGGGCESGSGGRPMTIDEDNNVQCSWTYLNGNVVESATMAGILSADKKTITGNWANSAGSSGNWSLTKVSNSTTPNSTGTLTIQGTFNGLPVAVNSTAVCAEKDYRAVDGPMLDDIEVNVQGVSDWWGIEFESPKMLAPGEFSIPASGFEIDFQSSVIEQMFTAQGAPAPVPNELAATSGSVSIQAYDGNLFRGTFAIQSQYYDLTGAFDVNLGQ